MCHRPLRSILSCTGSNPFIHILQAAAGTAWTRSFGSAIMQPKHQKPSQSSTPHKRVRPKNTHVTPPLAFFDENSVQDSDAWHFLYSTAAYELSSSERPWYWDDESVYGTSVSHRTFRRRDRSYPLAKSKSMLHQNIMHLSYYHNENVQLPDLIDYHDLHSGFQSTRSYNLLIYLALRNGAYGSAKWLFSSMHAGNIPGNLETWKLRVRCLVESGLWEQAWNESMHIAQKSSSSRTSDPLPLLIWVEFFRLPKRGNLPRPKPTDAYDPLKSTSLNAERRRALMKIRPTLTRNSLAQTHPNTIHSLVRIMLDLQKHAEALTLAKTYFTSISRHLPTSRAKACLDVIHLFIAHGSSQRGLARLYEMRRVMVSLITSNPSLRPSSKTLFLLLEPLRRAKRCGTVAWNIVRTFRKRWGRSTIDRRVRRRVTELALKEGRKDIADIMLRSERRSRQRYEKWHLMERLVGRSFVFRLPVLLRPPARKLYRGNGRESQHWRRLIRRLSSDRHQRRRLDTV